MRRKKKPLFAGGAQLLNFRRGAWEDFGRWGGGGSSPYSGDVLLRDYFFKERKMGRVEKGSAPRSPEEKDRLGSKSVCQEEIKSQR